MPGETCHSRQNTTILPVEKRYTPSFDRHSDKGPTQKKSEHYFESTPLFSDHK